MSAALKVTWDVLVYRLKRREMANLAGAVSIMVVLGLPAVDVAVRVVFATLLNLLVYLNNDYHDLELDLRAPAKDGDKTRYLKDHADAAGAAQIGMLLILAALATWWDPGLFIALIVGGGVCWAYSARLKHTPGLDIVAMMVWGLSMPLSGVPLERTLGLWMVLQLGLFSGVFETIQVLRDRLEDRELGVQTTAVALGRRRTIALARLLSLAAAAFMAAVLDPYAAALVALAALLPVREDAVTRHWDRVRALFGVAWLVVCARAFLDGETSGLLVSIPTAAGLPSWTV